MKESTLIKNQQITCAALPLVGDLCMSCDLLFYITNSHFSSDNGHATQNKSNTIMNKRFFAQVLLPNLTRTLREAFPGIPIYPILGNHDYWPKNELPGDALGDVIYDALSHLWRDWITDAGLTTFRRGEHG